MAETTPPPMTQGLTPYIYPSDAPAAAEFYRRAFGATDITPMLAEDGKRYMHCSLRMNGSWLFLSDAFPELGEGYLPPQGFNLHLEVDDPEFWWKRAVDAGCSVIMPLEKQFWGDIYGQLEDPFGIVWAIGSRAQEP